MAALQRDDLTRKGYESLNLAEAWDWLIAHSLLTDMTVEDERNYVGIVSQKIQQERMSTSVPAFAIIPTYECNMRCDYCFQGHDRHCSLQTMTLSMVDDAFGTMVRCLADVDKVPSQCMLTLFGGEPLLAKNKDLITVITQRAVREGFGVRAVTNGLELEPYEDLLHSDGISSLQITIDGPQAIHDKRRRGRSGEETFRDIVRNVDLALEKKIRVDVRVNVDSRNIRFLPELMGWMKSRGWAERSNFTAYSATLCPSRLSMPDGSEELLEGLENRCCGVALPDVRQVAIQSLLCTWSRRGRISRCASTPCAASTGFYLLDCQGDVYGCENDTGDRRRRIGRFGKHGLELIGTRLRELQGRTIDRIPECSDCPVALFCGGGCAHSAEFVNGRLLSPYCNGFRSSLAKGVADFFGRMENHEQ